MPRRRKLPKTATNKKVKTPIEAGGQEAQTVWVTPDMAVLWMEKNLNNRAINNHRISRYAEDMKQGNWKVTGDSLRFAKDGTLLDGQHRLWACIEAGVPFQTVVITGLDGNAQLLMDQGMPRTRGSQLAIMGHKRGATLASAAMNVWRMEGGRTRILTRALSPSNSTIFAILEENPDLHTCVEKYFSIKSRSGVRTMTGTSIAMYMYMRRYDQVKADSFMESYLSGMNLEHGHPALSLRERVLQYRHKNWKILHDEFLTWSAYAWRAYVKGKSLNRIHSRNRLPTFPGGPDWNAMEEETE